VGDCPPREPATERDEPFGTPEWADPLLRRMGEMPIPAPGRCELKRGIKRAFLPLSHGNVSDSPWPLTSPLPTTNPNLLRLPPPSKLPGSISSEVATATISPTKTPRPGPLARSAGSVRRQRQTPLSNPPEARFARPGPPFEVVRAYVLVAPDRAVPSREPVIRFHGGDRR
jgi:hypothetical protein